MNADRWGPLGSVFAAPATVGGRRISGVVAGAGLALLTGTSAWNWRLVRSRRAVDPETAEA